MAIEIKDYRYASKEAAGRELDISNQIAGAGLHYRGVVSSGPLTASKLFRRTNHTFAWTHEGTAIVI